MSAPTFEEILKAWVLDYDERLPTDRKERREAFIVLLGNLQDHGFGKEEINTSRKEKIVRSCVNPNHKNKQRLKRWISMVVNDLDSAVLIYYGTVKIRRDVVTPEMSAKLESMARKAEESKALAKPYNEAEDTENCDKPLNLEEKTIIDIHGNRVPLSSTLVDAEVVVTSDEVLEQMSGPEVVWDEDLIEELGIKLYE